MVGGGPGAGAAALRLASGGAQVTLFAPDQRGEKPCGGALPDFLLARLPGFSATALPAAVPPAAVCENGEGGRVEVPLAGIRIFRRKDLDPALLAAAEAAGVRRRKVKVEGLEVDGGRPTLRFRGGAESFDRVVAADGARGVVRRTLGLAPQGESLGLGASLEGAEPPAMVLALPGVADAYGWIFPRPGGASVGVAYSPGALSHGAARSFLAAFLARFLPLVRDRARPLYRYPIPVWGPWTVPAVEAACRRRVLLVGDAAAVADPLTREGIRYAVMSGLWAAEAILEDRPESYPRRLRAGLAAEMARARRACRLFFDDPVGQWMVPLARLHPGIRRVLSDLLSCRQPYRGLRRRLLRAVIGGG